jgi:hypothetical protein
VVKQSLERARAKTASSRQAIQNRWSSTQKPRVLVRLNKKVGRGPAVLVSPAKEVGVDEQSLERARAKTASSRQAIQNRWSSTQKPRILVRLDKKVGRGLAVLVSLAGEADLDDVVEEQDP